MTSPTDLLRVEVDVNAETYGWACIRIHATHQVHEITCSDAAGDSLGELARVFASLAIDPVGSAEVLTDDEVGLANIRITRRADDLEIELRLFKDEFDGIPDRLCASSGKPNTPELEDEREQARRKREPLRYVGSFVGIARTLVESFESTLQRIGRERYERKWGFPIPERELRTLRSLLSAGH